jgi:hypothetical protein
MKYFVNPLLCNLDVGCERQTDDDTQPITDKFLPRLSAFVGLEVRYGSILPWDWHVLSYTARVIFSTVTPALNNLHDSCHLTLSTSS